MRRRTRQSLIVKTIESADDGLTPDQAALLLFKGEWWGELKMPGGYLRCIGVQNGHAHITGDFLGKLFRASTRGATYKYK
jgi:hypothetical protein